MKKKIISLLLAGAVVLTMAGCGSKAEDVNTGADAVVEETGDEVVSEEETEVIADEEQATEEQNAVEETVAETEAEVEEEKTLENALPGEVVDGIVKVPTRSAVEIPDNDAMAFVRDMEVGWNLGNTFDAKDVSGLADELDYESAWCGVKTTKEFIAEIKNAGFKTIRIPVSWHNHVDADYNISEAWMDRVEEVVGWALDEDMYVIINIHHDDSESYLYPTYDRLDSSKKYVTKIWSQIADRFADYDEHLIFETLNEPRCVGKSYEWWLSDLKTDESKEAMDCVNQLNQAIVDTIRANGEGYNKTRYIMAPGYVASPYFAYADDYKLPDDSNADAENRIIVSIHAYTPYNFALNTNKSEGATDEFAIRGAVGTNDIQDFMKKMYDKFTSKGIPVVIGEFGALDKDNLDSRMQFAAYYTYTARHFGMTVVYWDNNAYKTNGENFQLIDRKTMTWTFPEIVDQLMYYCKSEE